MFHETKNGYQVSIPVYEGPLDLLLDLIEQAELDITRVALAQVTDQFLAYLRTLQTVSPDEVSAFLVIAAKLVQIKSEALLPRPPDREEGEEDPAEALARQLRVYKRFKDIAGWLGNRDSQGFQTYIRLAPPPKVDTLLELDGVTLEDLVMAGQNVFLREPPADDIGTIITPRKITIRDRIVRIVSELQRFGRSRFSSLLSETADRVELVVTFLAVLELVKRHQVIARQDTLFSEIVIHPADGQDYAREAEIVQDLEFDDYG